MAVVTLGNAISKIRGSIGNQVYVGWKSGVTYIRSKASAISNPQSYDQVAIRSNLAMLSKYWMTTLKQGQRDAWETFAKTKPGYYPNSGGVRNIIKGNNGIMSGINAFMLINQWIRSAGLVGPVQEDAPIGVVAPTPPTGLAAVWTTPSIVLTWTKPSVEKKGARCRIWLASRTSAVHKQLAASCLADDGTIPLLNAKAAQGADLPFLGNPGNFMIQMDTVDPDGTKSQPSMTVDVKVTNP
jgi:hypothetical protein